MKYKHTKQNKPFHHLTGDETKNFVENLNGSNLRAPSSCSNSIDLSAAISKSYNYSEALSISWVNITKSTCKAENSASAYRV